SSRDGRAFAERLSGLAEACLAFALDTLHADLAARHGDPGPYVLLALGKFGGDELGSGSDLEIVLVYRGAGSPHADGNVTPGNGDRDEADRTETTGPEPLRFGAFFERLTRELLRFWAIPENEMFALDTRLRPHGESGPQATSLAAWREYYAPGGAALDYERQALIRLRPLHGDEALARELRVARDAVAYTDPPVPIEATLELFARQAAAKTKKEDGVALWNAKFGPGGLAELEYGIQFLQLRHGAARPLARQHQWARALEALLELGMVSLAEFEHLYAANLFLRRLVNALRLSRGHSKDRYVHAPGGGEFSYLARRMGYVTRE